ncbi:biotin/lipoyl-containing protein [Nafulsella turpanensis]|uniref:biotin/lipoyl-containing protein n=1 Tax=Nafulsella turpanensis TaxID=1265690 RepID=UPI00034A44EE|nr:biotin/lipoyl-containing protein [Nafulsella turpanensis]
MYKASVNNGNNYQISYAANEIKVNDTPFDWDIRHISGAHYHIIRNGKSYRLEVVSALHEEKKFIIKINGQKQEVLLKDRYDLLLEKLGMSDLAAQKINQVKAPMPGLILDIKVEGGSEVKKGDTIMILEAMKMENILKSPGDGIVEAIKVKKGIALKRTSSLFNLSKIFILPAMEGFFYILFSANGQNRFF